ncbi:MAG: translocation/assembly module TamB, partial [Bacteroidia bacterium]|nr:translocation/assembly module TamB [Bacteroidia bacterium]
MDSKIHTDDLAFFSNNLSSYNELISVNGAVTGTIDNIRSKKLNLEIGTHTRFSGSAKLVGLPDIDKTHWDINSSQLKTNATDLARLIELEPVPKEFINLGNLEYIGVFKGYISDFTAIGDIKSDVGDVNTNLHYQHQTNPVYKGNISSQNLQLNDLIGSEKLGIANFDLDVDGSGITLEDLKSNVSGTISKFEFENYTYQNINVNGNVANNIYSGIFAIADPNLNLNFNGKLDASNDVPQINVTTNVAAINLKNIGLDSVDNILKFNGTINLEGSSIDNLVGDAELDNFEYKTETKTYSLRQVTLKSELERGSREYTLKSNLGNATITGDFIPSEFGILINHIEHIVNPLQFELPTEEIQSKNFVLDVTIDKYNSLFNEFLPGFIFDSAQLYVKYDYESQKLVSNNQIFKPDYDEVNSDWVEINLKNSGDSTPINYAINSDGLMQKDSILFDVLNAHGFIKNGVVNFETTTSKDSLLEIILTGRYIYVNDSSRVYIDDSQVDIYDKSWTLRPTKNPNIISTNGITEFRHFDFRNANEILFFDASLGNNSDKLNLFLTDFKIENLTPFVAGYDIDLSGSANGYVDVSNRDGYPFIESDLEVKNLQLNNDTLGDLTFSSSATEDLLTVNIIGQVTNGLLNDLSISGKIDFNNVNSPLDLTLETNKSSIKPFEKYLTGLASDINGYSTTNVHIVGPISNPKLTGEMVLEDLDFKVDYLQTRYTAAAIVDVTYNAFTIRESIVKDRFKKEGKITGKVTHNNYNKFNFDINIENLENFEIMNTKRVDNDVFYGTAFVDGKMQVKGPLDDILLIINAKSRKGTVVEIPLDNFETSGKLSYVEFVDITKDNNSFTEMVNSTAGVRMDFNFEVTNDASVTLVFDELLGDKINATAHGNLRMEINTFGDFNMYGGLTIDDGNYLFTAFDLINKYFTVTPGGTLFWDGNPYNATIDLEAIKREYPVPSTLLDGIIPSEELANYGDAIPADCILQLKGLLFNPSVSFDLAFPSQSGLGSNNNTELTTVIERIKLDQEELNRQVFALLVLGTFIPPSFATSSVYNAQTG